MERSRAFDYEVINVQSNSRTKVARTSPTSVTRARTYTSQMLSETRRVLSQELQQQM